MKYSLIKQKQIIGEEKVIVIQQIPNISISIANTLLFDLHELIKCEIGVDSNPITTDTLGNELDYFEYTKNGVLYRYKIVVDNYDLMSNFFKPVKQFNPQSN